MQPILAASTASGCSLVTAAATRRSCSGPLTRVAAQVEQHPELGLDAVPLEQVEDDPRFVVQLAGRDPEGIKRDAVPLQGLDLGIEARDVLGPPVIGEVLEAQPLEHRRPLLGPALLGIERHDAPGDEVVAGEERVRWACCLLIAGGSSDAVCGLDHSEPKQNITPTTSNA